MDHDGNEIYATYIGTATVLFEIGGLRLLTDPAFDPPGSKYWVRGFRTTTASKLTGPAIPYDQLGNIDVVLLSHEHHFDNLDTIGRIVCGRATRVVTTVSGSRQFKANGVGLTPWQSIEIDLPEGGALEVIATPARHGPWWMGPLPGEVIGFVIRKVGDERGGIYISGDTVLYRGIRAVAERLRPEIGFLHMGAGRFRSTGRIRYSMDANEAADAARLLGLSEFFPIHYDGWTHFSEPLSTAQKHFESRRDIPPVRWLTAGERVRIRAPETSQP